jgi:3',5'-cyclic AMP phosphodiesterase CpdA
MIRLCHLSDIHLTADPLGWHFEDWFNKRLAAWANLRILGRGHRFRDSERVLQALMDQLRQNPPDRLIFSGDATALGFETEIAHAARMLGLADSRPIPGLAVPGNHDYCTIAAQRSGDFERHFSRWQQGDRMDGEVYPFVQKVGHVWLVAVNTATANRWAWDASGAAGAEQLDRLTKLLVRLDEGPRILVTHYPLRTEKGSRENAAHGLRDVESMLRTAAEGGVSLWLHGHRHRSYHIDDREVAPFPVICAGSATQTGRWTYGDYAIEGRSFSGRRKVYEPASGQFVEAEKFTLEL